MLNCIIIKLIINSILWHC